MDTKWTEERARLTSKITQLGDKQRSVQIVHSACLSPFQACVSETFDFDVKDLDETIEQTLQLAISTAKLRSSLGFNVVDARGPQE
jgi:hypothetical protein